MFLKKSSLYVFLTCVFSTATISPHQNNLPSHAVHSFPRTIEELRQRKKLSSCRLIIIPAVIALTSYFNKSSIEASMHESPIAFLAAACFLSNYIIDTYAKYQTLKKTLELFMFSQTISHYILCMLTIKNEMKHQNEMKNTNFNEDDFYTVVIAQTGFSFLDLEKLSQELTSDSLHSINGLCANINTTNLDELLYFFSQEKISPEQLLSLIKDNKKLSGALLTFYQHPEEEYKNTLTMVCSLLKKHLHNIL